MARGRALAAGGRAALDEHDRLAARDVGETLEEHAAVGDAFDVREAHRGGVVVGVEVEVVGDADRGRVPRAHGPAHAHAGLHRPVQERRHEVARLARDRDAARGWVRAQRSARRARAGVDTTPCPFGPASKMPRSSRELDEIVLGAAALVARLAVTRAGEERGPDPPLRAPRAAGRGWRPRACRRRRGPMVRRGKLVDRAHRVDPEHRCPLEVRRTDRDPCTPQRGCCAARRSRTCPGCVDAPATTTPRGSNKARNASSVGRGPRGAAPRSRHASCSSTSASTATGLPSTTINGLTSTDAMSARSSAKRRQARARPHAARPGRSRARRGTRRAASGSRGRRRARRRRAPTAARSGTPTSPDRFGEHAADAEHHARTELRVAHDAGDELARAAHHRRDEELDVAVVGSGRARAACRGRRARQWRRRDRAAPAHVRSCARSRRRTASPPPGSRVHRPRRPRHRRRRPVRSSSTGTPYSLSNSLESASERVGTAPKAIAEARRAGTGGPLLNPRQHWRLRCVHRPLIPSTVLASTRRGGRASAACRTRCAGARRAPRSPAAACTRRGGARRTLAPLRCR